MQRHINPDVQVGSRYAHANAAITRQLLDENGSTAAAAQNKSAFGCLAKIPKIANDKKISSR